MIIRSRQWFFALISSMLVHIVLIQYAPIYQSALPVKSIVETSFTVMLADQEILEQLILEQPETIKSEALIDEDVIPMVSLDESQQQLVELLPASSGVALEVIPSKELESESVEMEEQTEMSVGATLELKMNTSPEITVDTAPEITPSTPSIPVEISARMPELKGIDTPTDRTPELAPVAAMELPTDNHVLDLKKPDSRLVQIFVPDLPSTPMKAPAGLPEPKNIEMPTGDALMVAQSEMEEELIPTDLESLISTNLLSDAAEEMGVSLAEIQIEQIEFDTLEMEMLPQVTAKDWKPVLPEETQLGQRLSTVKSDNVKSSRSKSWRSRYSGAKGIGFAYRARMRVKLTGFTLYPKYVAEEQGIQGKVLVGFVLNRSGELLETEIIQSSGHEILDRAVEQMVEMAQPFEVFPDEVNNDKIGFAFPVTIKLKR